MRPLISLSSRAIRNPSQLNPAQHSILTYTTCRMSSTTSPPPSVAPKPTFSSTYPAAQGTADLSPLLKANGGKWTLIESGKGVERGFRFKTFKKTWEFMNIIASECAVQKHHPEWSNVYNTTFIRWTTHSPPGLSEKDVLMARFCDEKAVECGEVVTEGVEEKGIGRELVDRVAVEGGDCCVPKGKGTL